ncbi:uncharacterized protein LOC125498672 [Beta vulgaris subsp. vulgaris]|uniref:uncharacterized protein LOC125498672 n=1 Tax=Beta vulgaris subsp. vulgaris TaxID=3555 RepID=UPI002036B644|nr:uncharacterized protein LOC125498672 [Beta vulgaris subsp. vulgaris]
MGSRLGVLVLLHDIKHTGASLSFEVKHFGLSITGFYKTFLNADLKYCENEWRIRETRGQNASTSSVGESSGTRTVDGSSENPRVIPEPPSSPVAKRPRYQPFEDELIADDFQNLRTVTYVSDDERNNRTFIVVLDGVQVAPGLDGEDDDDEPPPLENIPVEEEEPAENDDPVEEENHVLEEDPIEEEGPIEEEDTEEDQEPLLDDILIEDDEPDAEEIDIDEGIEDSESEDEAHRLSP